jgi:hypothetical protein
MIQRINLNITHRALMAEGRQLLELLLQGEAAGVKQSIYGPTQK